MMKIEPLFQDLGCIVHRNKRFSDVFKITPDLVLPLLRRHGVVMFRGFDLDLDKFKRFTDRFSSKFLVHLHPSIRPTMGEDRTITGVLKGNDIIYLHGEMYYLPERPHQLWLFCSVPPSSDGETTVVSSVKFLENLSPGTRRLFEEKKVRYCHTLTPDKWKESFSSNDIESAIGALKRKSVKDFEVLPDQSLRFWYVISAILKLPDGRRGFINSIANISQYSDRAAVEFEDGTPIGAAVLQEIIDVGERSAELVKWQPNDLLLIDNSWIMHGRRAFNCPRQIATRFGMAA